MMRSRKAPALLLALASTLPLTIGARALGAQQASPSTPHHGRKTGAASSHEQGSPATKLLRQAAENLAAVHTLQFTLATHMIPQGLHLSGVVEGNGSVVLPDQLVFRGAVQRSPALALPFVLAMCGPDQYVQMGDTVFQKVAGFPNVGRLLFSPDTSFVAKILTGLERVAAPKTATLDNAAMWHVTGVVPNRALTALPGHALPSAPPLQADLWIGQQDLQVHRVLLTGPMFEGDSAQTSRTLSFSHINQQVSLTVPHGHVPCGAAAAKGTP